MRLQNFFSLGQFVSMYGQNHAYPVAPRHLEFSSCSCMKCWSIVDEGYTTKGENTLADMLVLTGLLNTPCIFV